MIGWLRQAIGFMAARGGRFATTAAIAAALLFGVWESLKVTTRFEEVLIPKRYEACGFSQKFLLRNLEEAKLRILGGGSVAWLRWPAPVDMRPRNGGGSFVLGDDRNSANPSRAISEMLEGADREFVSGNAAGPIDIEIPIIGSSAQIYSWIRGYLPTKDNVIRVAVMDGNAANCTISDLAVALEYGGKVIEFAHASIGAPFDDAIRAQCDYRTYRAYRAPKDMPPLPAYDDLPKACGCDNLWVRAVALAMEKISPVLLARYLWRCNPEDAQKLLKPVLSALSDEQQRIKAVNIYGLTLLQQWRNHPESPANLLAAIRWYEEAIRHYPRQRNFNLNLGLAYVEHAVWLVAQSEAHPADDRSILGERFHPIGMAASRALASHDRTRLAEAEARFRSAAERFAEVVKWNWSTAPAYQFAGRALVEAYRVGRIRGKTLVENESPADPRRIARLREALTAEKKELLHRAVSYFQRAAFYNHQPAFAHAETGHIYRVLAGLEMDKTEPGAAIRSLQNAVRHFAEATRLAPTDGKAHRVLGTVRIESCAGCLSQSIENFALATELIDREDQIALSGAHRELALALVAAGRVTEGRTHFRTSTEIHPENSLAYLEWGNALWKQNLACEALARFDRAMTIKSETRDWIFSRALHHAEALERGLGVRQHECG